MGRKIQAYVEIIRLSVCGLTLLAFLAGAAISTIYELVSMEKIILGLIAAFLICASGNVINDYFDVEMDKINRPTRPIPSGRIKPNEAMIFYVLLIIVGNLLAYYAGTYFFILAVFNTFVAFIYAWKLKKTALVGNMMDSYLAASVFIAPLFLLENFSIRMLVESPAFILGVIAFFGNMGREILKDVEDMEGDKRAGARTLPVVAGTRKSKAFAYIFITTGIVMAWLPALSGVLTTLYLPFLLISSLLVVVSFIKHKNVSLAQRILKIVMYLVIAGFIAGSV